MALQIRTASPRRGWAWIAGGFLLFVRSPLQWLLLLLVLFIVKKALAGFPVPLISAVFSILAVLLMPVFLAGLMDGCRSLMAGERLQPGHLLQGFRHNAAGLVTLGGVSLIGNLVIIMIIAGIGGDAMSTMAKAMSAGEAPAPRGTGEMQAAATTMARAALVGAMLSLPLLMALWFAPLLVFFDNVKPLAALRLSLVACLRNILPMLVYSLVLIAALFLLTPLALRLREFDLALWLLAPILLPSVYLSYLDIFIPVEDGEPPAAPPA